MGLISISDTPKEAVLKMAKGNPGALNVLMAIVSTGSMSAAASELIGLDEMKIRGAGIWVAYKDHCQRNLEKFRECIRSRDETMIDLVRAEGYLE